MRLKQLREIEKKIVVKINKLMNLFLNWDEISAVSFVIHSFEIN